MGTEVTNKLMTDTTGQSIASAISTMSNSSIGNLSALTTTDKTSLVGAVNEVKSGLANLVKVATKIVTTDNYGDASFALPEGGTILVSVRPLRDTNYYNSWWGAIIASRSANTGYGIKAIGDDGTALATQEIKFDVYYI